MPDYLELQVSCLAGGAILEVHSLAEAQAAEDWGAVAVFFSNLDVLSDQELCQLVERVSLHPVCTPTDFPRLSAAYKERTPHHFARLPIASWGSPSRAFADAASPSEAKEIFEQEVARPHLVICKERSVLPTVVEERTRVGAATLVFFESATIEGGADALRNGANGVLLTRADGQSMPTEEDQQTLMDAVIQAPVGEWPKKPHVIGVMSHQGDYLAHLAAFEAAIERLGAKEVVMAREIRTSAQFGMCSAVVLPGGWSNLQTLYLENTGIDRMLRTANDRGLPVLGTCAGMILCGSKRGKYAKGRVMLGLVPGTVDNNLVDGFTKVTNLDDGKTQDILFSNGPVLRDSSDSVKVLTETLDAGQVVAAQYGSTFVYSYHDYERTHSAFLEYCLMRWADGER